MEEQEAGAACHQGLRLQEGAHREWPFHITWQLTMEKNLFGFHFDFCPGLSDWPPFQQVKLWLLCPQ